LVQVKVPGTERTVSVHKEASEAFKGFLGELQKTGYKMSDVQGYNPRQMRGGSGWSEHAFGTAIDINPGKNAMGGSSTDMPAGIKELAAKYGLVWGGDWKGKSYDPMHFQWGGPRAGGVVNQPAAAGTPAATPAGGYDLPKILAEIEKHRAGAAGPKIEPFTPGPPKATAKGELPANIDSLTQEQQHKAYLAAGRHSPFGPSPRFNKNGFAVSADIGATLPGQQAPDAGNRNFSQVAAHTAEWLKNAKGFGGVLKNAADHARAGFGQGGLMRDWLRHQAERDRNDARIGRGGRFNFERIQARLGTDQRHAQRTLNNKNEVVINVHGTESPHHTARLVQDTQRSNFRHNIAAARTVLG
jgi:hypothetical protein